MMSTPRSTNHNNNNNNNNNNNPSNNVDQALIMYIFDYCLKRNLKETAAALQTEARINLIDNPIRFNTPEGFLKDWWHCFWNVFHASVSNQPHSDLGVYLEKIRTTSEGNAPPFPFGASPESDSNNSSGVKNTPLQTLATSTQGHNQPSTGIPANQLSGHSPATNIPPTQVKQEPTVDNSLLKDKQGNVQNSQALPTSGIPQTTQVRPPTSISLPMNNPMMTAAAWGLQQGQTQQPLTHQMAGVAGRPPQALQNPNTSFDPSNAMRPPSQMPVAMNPALQYQSNPALQSAALGSNITQAYMNFNDPNMQVNNDPSSQYALIAQHNYRQQLLMQNRQLAHSMAPGQPTLQRPANLTEAQQQEFIQRQQAHQRFQQLQQNALQQSGVFSGNPMSAMNLNMAMAMRINPMAQASLQGANMMHMGMNPMQAQQMSQAQNGTPQPHGSAQPPQLTTIANNPNVNNVHASPAPISAPSASQPANIPDVNGGLPDNVNNNNTSITDSNNADSRNTKEDPSDMFNFDKYINMNGSSSPMVTNNVTTTADLQPPSSVTRDDIGNNLEDFIGNDPFGNAEFF